MTELADISPNTLLILKNGKIQQVPNTQNNLIKYNNQYDLEDIFNDGVSFHTIDSMIIKSTNNPYTFNIYYEDTDTFVTQVNMPQYTEFLNELEEIVTSDIHISTREDIPVFEDTTVTKTYSKDVSETTIRLPLIQLWVDTYDFLELIDNGIKCEFSDYTVELQYSGDTFICSNSEENPDINVIDSPIPLYRENKITCNFTQTEFFTERVDIEDGETENVEMTLSEEYMLLSLTYYHRLEQNNDLSDLSTSALSEKELCHQ